jgi:hypothetical protein
MMKTSELKNLIARNSKIPAPVGSRPIDDDGQAVDLIIVEGEPAALLTTPAANSRLDGVLESSELQPLPGAPPQGRGANFETEIRDSTPRRRPRANPVRCSIDAAPSRDRTERCTATRARVSNRDETETPSSSKRNVGGSSTTRAFQTL